MTDKEILELARSKEGGEWNAIDPAIQRKLIMLARIILKKSPWIKLRDLQEQLRQQAKEENESQDGICRSNDGTDFW